MMGQSIDGGAGIDAGSSGDGRRYATFGERRALSIWSRVGSEPPYSVGIEMTA